MRGISAILVIVLLAVIVISLVTLMYPLFTSLFTTTTGVAQTMANQTVTGLMAGMRVELKYINDVTVRNVGTTNLSGFTVLINGEQSDFTADPSVIEPDKLGTVKILDFLKEGDEITILSSEGATVTTKAPDPCDEAVLCLNFDEGFGTFVEDTSRHTDNDGEFYEESFNEGMLMDYNLTNADGDTPPQRVEGKYGKGLKFDGSDDYVDIADSDSLHLANNSDGFTVEAWVKANEIKSSVFVTKIGTFFLGMAGSSHFYIYLNSVNEGWHNAGCNARCVMNTNEWYHVAMTYDAATSSGNCYCNGISIANITDTTGNLKYTTQKARIGTWSGSGLFFNGTIDEVRIYNRVLIEEEIKESMQSSRPVKKPVASYSFEETGQYANDTHIWVKGKYGSALSFDGVNDYVNITTPSFNNELSAITFETWVKIPSGSANEQVFISRGASWGPGNVILQLEGIYGMRFLINEESADTRSGADIKDGQWHHLVGTWNDENDETKIYVDGVLKKTGSFSGPLPSRIDDSFIASRAGSFPTNGTIDEVRIYNKAIY